MVRILLDIREEKKQKIETSSTGEKEARRCLGLGFRMVDDMIPSISGRRLTVLHDQKQYHRVYRHRVYTVSTPKEARASSIESKGYT